MTYGIFLFKKHEYRFMYQGSPRHLSVILPRWVITLEEKFAGDWSGSYHPLLHRGIASDIYAEEAFYIKQKPC